MLADRRPLRLRVVALHLPPLRLGSFVRSVYPRPNIMLRQFMAGPLELLGRRRDHLLRAAGGDDVGFLVVLGVFLASFSAALLSHAPGGLGCARTRLRDGAAACAAGRRRGGAAGVPAALPHRPALLRDRGCHRCSSGPGSLASHTPDEHPDSRTPDGVFRPGACRPIQPSGAGAERPPPCRTACARSRCGRTRSAPLAEGRARREAEAGFVHEAQRRASASRAPRRWHRTRRRRPGGSAKWTRPVRRQGVEHRMSRLSRARSICART